MTPRTVTILIAGETVPAGRPKFGTVRKRDGSSFVTAFTPATTRKWQAEARFIAQQQMGNQPPLSGALTLKLTVYLPIPKSLSRIKTDQALHGILRPTTRPDLDNYIKNLDAFNNLVWYDDSQIVTLMASKHYSDRPRVEIIVSENVPFVQRSEQAQLL